MAAPRTALIVMDFQHAIVERLGNDAVVDAAARAIAGARAAGVPVLFVRAAFRPGYPEVADRNQTFSAAANAGEQYHEDHPSTQIHAALAAAPGDPIVVKRRVSAFTGSDLEVLLRGEDVDSIVLAGLSTSGVVLSTLRQAADLDYRITVLSDACADNDPEVHRVLTEKVFPRQARVCSTDEWVESL